MIPGLDQHALTCHYFCGLQIQEAEQDLRDRAELEARLGQINSWIADQNLWISSARTPSSQTGLQRSIRTCQVRGHSCSRTSVHVRV